MFYQVADLSVIITACITAWERDALMCVRESWSLQKTAQNLIKTAPAQYL